MLPFDRYPDDGKTLLPSPNRANTRREDAPRLQHLSGQTSCAYCGVDLVRDYHRWLLTSIDHVIPVSEGLRLGIPEAWYESFSNTVICCAGCNGLDNRFKIDGEQPRTEWTLPEFFALRDRAFKARRVSIMKRRTEEWSLFTRQPWTDQRVPAPGGTLREAVDADPPHLVRLRQFVERIRQDPRNAGRDIPGFDPQDGGEGAKVLFVLEAPGPTAIEAGFVSSDNRSPTARHFRSARNAAALDRRLTALWNIVPWYLGTGTQIRSATAADIGEGWPYLLSLVNSDLLPELQVVALAGKKAQTVRPFLATALCRDVQIETIPHPSARSLSTEAKKSAFVDALRRIAAMVDGTR